MPAAERKVRLARFILVADLLEQAFPGPAPTPDHLAHECELAEQALSKATAKEGITGDAALAALFALTYRRS